MESLTKEKLDNLEFELKILQGNIQRIREFAENKDNKTYKPYSSNVVGEFKHRIIALKSTLTIASKITTYELFK